MFHYLPPKKSKHPKRSTMRHQEYIVTTIGSPRAFFDTTSDEIETTLKGNIHDMRRQFRRVAKKIKDTYSHS